jgi:hypothetical protein
VGPQQARRPNSRPLPRAWQLKPGLAPSAREEWSGEGTCPWAIRWFGDDTCPRTTGWPGVDARPRTAKQPDHRTIGATRSGGPDHADNGIYLLTTCVTSV